MPLFIRIRSPEHVVDVFARIRLYSPKKMKNVTL